jgi:hypothetical protein
VESVTTDLRNAHQVRRSQSGGYKLFQNAQLNRIDHGRVTSLTIF